jgi:hypothetical protein
VTGTGRARDGDPQPCSEPEYGAEERLTSAIDQGAPDERGVEP